jgi:tetratricopeptide (TPR) repeat protein
VADLTSTLTREQKRRFWALKGEANRLFGQGRWEEAAAVFAEMTALDPAHEDALYNRGNCLLELERYAEANATWERLIRVNPASSRAWIQIGIDHALPESGQLFDLEAAAAAFEAAHRLNREESQSLALWGEAVLAQGRLDDAHRILQSAHRMNPRSSAALYLSAYIAWKRGNEGRARELAEQTRASFESIQSVRGVLGEGDTRTDDMAAARRKAAGRRLFAACLEEFRGAPATLDPERAFACVDRRRASLLSIRAGAPLPNDPEDRS